LSAPRQSTYVSDGDDDPSSEGGTGEAPNETAGSGSDRTPQADSEQDSTDGSPESGSEPTGGSAAPDADHDASHPDDVAQGAAPDAYAVPTTAGSDAETAWLRELADAGELTPEAVDTMLSVHDDRGGRALEAVSEGRVKQYRDFTVVVGHEDEYVVEAGGCTCKDSAYNLDPGDPDDRCWHVLAVAIAERIGEIDHHSMWYSEVREFL
jgi:predicted nucleic acid-binding Zn finger protein